MISYTKRLSKSCIDINILLKSFKVSLFAVENVFFMAIAANETKYIAISVQR